MKLQMLLGKVRKVCDMYDLIQEGDKIAVGISGGKDSLTLLHCLADMRIFYPKKYQRRKILKFKNSLNLRKITKLFLSRFYYFIS